MQRRNIMPIKIIFIMNVPRFYYRPLNIHLCYFIASAHVIASAYIVILGIGK